MGRGEGVWKKDTRTANILKVQIQPWECLDVIIRVKKHVVGFMKYFTEGKNAIVSLEKHTELCISRKKSYIWYWMQYSEMLKYLGMMRTSQAKMEDVGVLQVYKKVTVVWRLVQRQWIQNGACVFKFHLESFCNNWTPFSHKPSIVFLVNWTAAHAATIDKELHQRSFNLSSYSSLRSVGCHAFDYMSMLSVAALGVSHSMKLIVRRHKSTRSSS